MSDVVPNARQAYERQFLEQAEKTLVSIYVLIGTGGRHITNKDNRLIYKISSKFMGTPITKRFPEIAARASSEAGLSPYSHWEGNAIKAIWRNPEKFEKGIRRWGVIQRAKSHFGAPKTKKLLRG